jgi:hypothetical protein
MSNTYCTAICNNLSCPKMLTKSVLVKSANGEQWVKRSNLSEECPDYIEVLSMTEMEEKEWVM